MTAASGTTTVHGTVRGSTGIAMTMTTIGRRCGNFEAARRDLARATETGATTTDRASARRSVAVHPPLPHGVIATTGMTTVTAGAARRSAEGRAVSCTMTTVARVVTEGDLKLHSVAGRRRLRRATDADRLVKARRPSRSAVVRTGGQVFTVMEAAHSPGVVVLASAASVVTASVAGMTALALALDRSRTAVDLRPLVGDLEAADAGPATTTMTLAVGAGGVTATEVPTN